MSNIFSDISDFLFGGTDTSAQDAANASRQEARQAIDTSTQQARTDVLNLFPQADVNRNLGFQAALDVLGQSAPAQAAAFQGGNVAAQGNLLAGLPQFQNAILGDAIDLSGLQPTTLAFDPSMFQQQLPQFGGIATPRTATQQNTAQQQAIAALLSGAGNFSQPAGGFDDTSGTTTGFAAGAPTGASSGGSLGLESLLGGINPFAEEGPLAGVGSTARDFGKLAGAAGFFNPLGTGAEAIAGLSELSALNERLSSLGIDNIGILDALKAGFNPLEDLRDIATQRIQAQQPVSAPQQQIPQSQGGSDFGGGEISGGTEGFAGGGFGGYGSPF